jgi:hypothetical protein
MCDGQKLRMRSDSTTRKGDVRQPVHLSFQWLDYVQMNWEHQRGRFTPRQIRQLLRAVDNLHPGESDVRTAPIYQAMTPAELRQRLIEGDIEAGWEIATRYAHHFPS